MTKYLVRTLTRDDFTALMSLENEMFGQSGDGVLGPYYIRLCCDFFSDSCFIVESQGRPIGYLLSFVKGREAYCTTLAMLPDYQGTRALVGLLRALTQAVIDRVDLVWFTVESDNRAARALHRMLGAEEVEVREDFYGPGRPRIVSRIDRESLVKARDRFERLGLLKSDKDDNSAAQVA